MPQGKGSQLHNRREYGKIGRPVPDNIDVSKSRENVTLVDKDVRQAYEDIFGEALERYNSKQKRSDRKIENYYEHIQKSKNGEKLFYEDVVQWGGKDDFQNLQTRERAKEALVKYVEGFEGRNPNLKLIGAYIHMDEASPHLHLDYVPVAHGYSRGLPVRNSLDRAMKEMGFVPEKESRKNNATKLWKENERVVFGEICRGLGLEVEAERKARGSLSVEEYKAARDVMLGDLEQEYTEKKAQVEKMDAIASYCASEGRETVKAENMTIPAKKAFWGKIEAPERVGVFVEGMDEGQVEALVDRVRGVEKIEDTLERTQAQCRSLVDAAKEEAAGIKAEATAERNKTIANAEAVIRERDGILAKAREWAESVKKQYRELVEKVQQLFAKKESLEEEISDLQKEADRLEEIETRVALLEMDEKALLSTKAILSGEVENELSRARFFTPSVLQTSEKWERYRKGELMALYLDGQFRRVTPRTLDKITLDEQDEICRIGWFLPEEQITIPRRLLKELIDVRDRAKPISQDLETMISQQNTVHNTVHRIIDKGRTQGRSR